MKKFIAKIWQLLCCKKVKFDDFTFFLFAWIFWCEAVNYLNLRPFIIYALLLVTLFMISFFCGISKKCHICPWAKMTSVLFHLHQLKNV